MSAAILSDLDGVLVDSAAAVARAWRAWAARIGQDPEHVLASLHGRPTLAAVRAIAPHLDASAEAARVEAEQVDDVSGVLAMPGAAELVAAPPRPLAVVTSCTRPLALARLRAAGLRPPAVTVTADQLERGKPHPDGYRLAAERLGVAPEACVVVEDAPGGVAAGKAAGATVVAVTTTHAEAELAEADVVVADLAAFRAWLGD